MGINLHNGRDLIIKLYEPFGAIKYANELQSLFFSY